ncbi:MAG: alpha/beta hydrolase [bacterium]|nr:alpha/beta hydrolase [bacterium]
MPFAFAGCSFHTDREAARQEFPPEIVPEFLEYRVGERRMGYVRVQRDRTPEDAAQSANANANAKANRDARPLIVFIHGSPGGWNAYLEYLRSAVLLDAARLISVDRAGYGASDAGRPEPNLAQQAALIAPILFSEHENPGQGAAGKPPVVLVGHSYGGPVAVQLAMDYPDRVSGLVLIAASVDPDLEEWRWFNRLAELSFTRWILPAAWDVSNQELKPLREDLTEILSRWGEIRGPVALVHGEDDRLVPVANLDFARDRLRNARVAVHRYEAADHFILWDRPEEMSEIILETLEQAANAQ